LTAAAGFTIRGLTAGRYVLFALTSVSGEMQWARETIEIQTEDMNVNVKLLPAARISGRIASAGGLPLGIGELSKASIVLQNAESDGSGVAPPRAAINPDGTFTVSDIVPGSYRLSIANLPKPWSVVGADQDGRNVLDEALVIQGPNPAPLTITLGDRPSELAGVFSEASGQPATDYFVIVFSDDPRQWFPKSRRVVAIRPRSDGSFLTQNLPDGRYRMAAVSDVQPDEWFERSFLEQLMPGSVAVTIRAGQRTEQNLRVGR
jgi:hypothetical protein